jgi:hypothetical protein
MGFDKRIIRPEKDKTMKCKPFVQNVTSYAASRKNAVNPLYA